MARKLGEVASMTMFDALIEGAVLVRPDSGKVVLANRAAAVMFGYISPEAMVGADPLDHIPPEDRGRIAGIMAGYFVEGNLQKPMEVRALALDGRELWVSALGVQIQYEGKVAGLILMSDITAQKAVERSLAEAEERQRQILDNANESILVLQDGNVVYANRKALELGSFIEDEILRKPFVDFLVPEDRERVMRRYLKKAESRDYASTFVVRGLGKNGTVRWSEIREASFMWEGKPAEICLVKDITEQKRAEEALAVSERRYRLLTENVSDVIWVTDLQLKPTYFNPSVTRLLGYSVEEAMAGAMKMTPASLGAATKAFTDAMRREEVRPGSASGAPKMDLEYIHKDGSTVWAETTVSFLRDSKGEPFAVLGILHDVSERREAEEALRKSEERFRALIENASDAIIVLGAKGEIIYESPNSQRAVERKVSGLFGPQLLQVIHPDDVKKILDLFELIKDRPGKGVETEVRFKHKDGTWHTIEGSARNLLRDSRVNGIVINYRNTTEKRNAEKALRDSEAKYRGLFEGTQTAIQVISMDTGRVVLANEAAARMWGFDSAQSVIGVDPLDFVQPEDRDWVAQRMAETLAGQRSGETMELRVQASDGRWVWVSAMAGTTEYQGKPALLVSLLDITRRREIEDTLRASEEKYRFLVDNTGDFIWTRDLNLRTTYASPSVERILGFTPEERLNQDLSQQATPESLARARDTVLSYLALEEDPQADPRRTMKIEMEYYRKDGSTAWLESQVSGIRDSNGNIIAFHGVSRDITDRRKAEQALRESETRYRLLADNATDVIWATDAALKMTYVSPSVTGLLGYSVGEIIGGSFEKLLAPASLEHVAEVYAADIKSEESGSGIVEGRIVEVELLRNDGSAVWVETTINTLRNEDGRLAGFQGACRDLTARRAAQESLRASEEKYRLLAENVADVIFVVDLDLRPNYFSPSATRMLGYSVEEAMAGTLESKMTDASYGAAIQLLRQAIADEGTEAGDVASRSLVLELKHKDGSTRLADVTASFLRDEGGRPTGIIGTLHDITERKRAEEALIDSERRYRLLAENLSDVIWVINTDLQFTYVSPSVERLLGYSAEEALALPVQQTVIPASFDLAMTVMDEAAERERAGQSAPGRSVTLELELPRKDGSTVWTENRVSYLRDSSGRVTGYLGVSRDISERRKGQEALRASEERFRTLIEESTDAIAIIDTAGKLLYESPSMERITGYRVEDWQGTPVTDWFIHPDDLATLATLLERAAGEPNATIENVTARFKHKDGTWHTLEATVRNLVHDPKVGGLLINYRDVTERVKAEDERRRLREYLQLQIKRMPTGLITWDREFRVQSWNPAAGEIFGFTAEEVLGKHPYDCIVPEEAQPHVDHVWRRLLEGDMTAYSVNENTTKDGRTILCQWTNTPLREADGRVIGVLSMVQDITERKKAEEALRSSEERFRTIFEQSPIGAIVYDSTGAAVGANKVCLEIFGLSSVAEMKGPTLFGDPNSTEKARRRLRNGETVVGEVQIDLDEAKRTGLYSTTRSGTACLRLTATPLGTDQEGAARGYLVMVEDITERKKAEEALRSSEERFRTIFEQSPIGAIVFDSAGVALSANKACMDIFGLSGEADLKGPKLLSDPLLTDGARRRLSAGKSITAESQINLDEAKRIHSYRYGRSGTVFVHLTITPLGANVKGVPSGYLAMVEDITERKKAEEALRSSEERFRGLVETTSDWVWEVDAKGVYTYASPRVKKVLGYDSRELVGKTPFEFMPQREAHRVAAVFNGFAAKREPFAFLENVNRHKNGRPVVMETSGVPFFAPDGTLLGYRGVDRDITERKQVGRQLQQSLRRLERTMEAIIQAISATIETRDPYTAGHQRRVTQLACIIARDMNLPSTQIAGIRFAGLLHDIGKICVPTEILNKPGQLSDVEMALIRAHPKVGYGILKSIEFEWPVADIVVQHHERLDGSGYPAGIKGEEILLEARILAVADVVEAMSSHRPYRPAVGMEKALAEITRGQGTLYDSVVVHVCLDIFKKKGFQFEAF